MTKVSKEIASKIAARHVQRRKYTEKVDVAAVEEKDGDWFVRGICPIDLAGHLWAEKFGVAVDQKGKVK